MPKTSQPQPKQARKDSGKREEDKQERAVKEGRVLVARAYPNIDGCFKKVVHLWGDFFRINYVHEGTGYIPTSAFVKVTHGQVTKYEEPEYRQR